MVKPFVTRVGKILLLFSKQLKDFILASILYKVVQWGRSSIDDSSINTIDLLSDLDETSSKLCASVNNFTSSEFSHKCSKLESDCEPQSKKQHSDQSI